LRILGFADFHGRMDSVKQASRLVSVKRPEVVVVAGDLANRDVQKAESILEELSKFASKVLFVPGNMDEQALANRKDNGRVVCLHGKGIAHDGAWFMGLGGAAASPFRAPFELDEAEADRILAGTVGASSSQFSVLVSHCPPKDTKVDLAAGRWHVGSEAVRRFIEKNRPTLVVCGHIHEAQGIDAIGKTSIVNVGPAAHGQYASISLLKPVKIELERF
jgi:hypothetical protein